MTQVTELYGVSVLKSGKVANIRLKPAAIYSGYGHKFCSPTGSRGSRGSRPL